MIENIYYFHYLDVNEKSHFETLTEAKSLRANLRIAVSGHNEPVDAALTAMHRLDWTTIKQETMARQTVRTAPESDKVGRHFGEDKEDTGEQVQRFVLAIATYTFATGWPTQCDCTPLLVVASRKLLTPGRVCLCLCAHCLIVPLIRHLHRRMVHLWFRVFRVFERKLPLSTSR